LTSGHKLDLASIRLPRRNGNPTFDAPWQSRAFGMAVALCDGGSFEWEEFMRLLDPSLDLQDAAEFYANWIDALNTLVLEKNLLTRPELRTREDEFATQRRDAVI
jgi:nitrile hydratase accessory protein